jgi:osmotically-inducible protein OsmY
MRRKYLGWAIVAIATLGPVQAWGGDRDIAEQIIKRLKEQRDTGALKDFNLDMKVDSGVVLFRGELRNPDQRLVVLDAAQGVDGVAKIVDELNVVGNTTDAKILKPKAVVANASREVETALAETTIPESAVRRVAAVEPTHDDQAVTQSVVSALGQAQKSGQLRGFGVDVKSNGGVVELTGRAASEAQRDAILRIASNAPGVVGVREAIEVTANSPSLTPLPEPISAERGNTLAQAASHRLQPVPARPASMQYEGGMAVTPVSSAPIMGAPISGGPVPMGPYAGGMASPHYDSPYLPNYAWPGYAAYPNYAAVTYPQQYSPSAWPYIGPFYPYPQVPLGWRRVSLEWDDGWWFLDFTDR